MDKREFGKRIIALKNQIVQTFTGPDWQELGLLLGKGRIVQGHNRLLRSLSFRDADYESNAIEVLTSLVGNELNADRVIPEIEDFVASKCGNDERGEYISSHERSGRRILFSPEVFEIPSVSVDSELVSVMMPFDSSFDGVFKAINAAAAEVGLTAKRADDIWEHTTLIQDVFSLIFESRIVVCDFSGKNPNVFYEAGIAHTLGKHVVPITQSNADIPFDVGHHRYLVYLNNGEGLKKLRNGLSRRLQALTGA